MENDNITMELLNRIIELEKKVQLLEANLTQNQTSKTKNVRISKKYIKLTEYLSEKTGVVQLKFKDIEKILGFKLPASAYEHPSFWANTTSHSIAHSWDAAGYMVFSIDLEKEQVVFAKKYIIEDK